MQTAATRLVVLLVLISDSEISRKKDMIIHSFKKCGISMAIDGTEDNEINIGGVCSWRK